jgi:hypothetical protein
MAKWTDYTTDTNPTDTDEVMTLDTDKTPKANKRVTLSTLADYFLDKLASKVFAKLETQNKTVIGAINELNNPTFSEAETRNNINSGESIPTLFGKVKKWFTDLNTLIKLVGSADISGIGNGTVTGALLTLNSKAQIDTSVIYYQDSEYHALGGIDECVKDAVTKNRFPKEGTFFKSFIAGSRYLAVGYRYDNGTYGLIVLYRYGLKLDSRYSIESGIFSKIS